MKFDGIIADLKSERDRIERAIAVLEKFDSRSLRGGRTVKMGAVRKPRKYGRAPSAKLVRKRTAALVPSRRRKTTAKPRTESKRTADSSQAKALGQQAAV